jgi:hypothetical protein
MPRAILPVYAARVIGVRNERHPFASEGPLSTVENRGSLLRVPPRNERRNGDGCGLPLRLLRETPRGGGTRDGLRLRTSTGEPPMLGGPSSTPEVHKTCGDASPPKARHWYGHDAAMEEDAQGHYAFCGFCGYEGKRRSVRQDAVLDANAHRRRHHVCEWYVRPGVKHQRSKPREATG